MQIASINNHIKCEDIIAKHLNEYSNMPVKFKRIPFIEYYYKLTYPVIEVTEEECCFDIKKSRFRTKFKKYHRFKTKTEYDFYIQSMKKKTNYCIRYNERPLWYKCFGLVFAISDLYDSMCYHTIMIDEYNNITTMFKDKEIFEYNINLPLYSDQKEVFSAEQYNEIIDNYNR
jgi:hypothetical protein